MNWFSRLIQKYFPKKSKWEQRCGKIYWRHRFQGFDRNKVCRHFVAILADEMMIAGEPFDLLLGKWEDAHNKMHYHCWMQHEYQGRLCVLEPSNPDGHIKNFTVTHCYKANQKHKGHDTAVKHFIEQYKAEIT